MDWKTDMDEPDLDMILWGNRTTTGENGSLLALRTAKGHEAVVIEYVSLCGTITLMLVGVIANIIGLVVLGRLLKAQKSSHYGILFAILLCDLLATLSETPLLPITYRRPFGLSWEDLFYLIRIRWLFRWARFTWMHCSDLLILVLTARCLSILWITSRAESTVAFAENRWTWTSSTLGCLLALSLSAVLSFHHGTSDRYFFQSWRNGHFKEPGWLVIWNFQMAYLEIVCPLVLLVLLGLLNGFILYLNRKSPGNNITSPRSAVTEPREKVYTAVAACSLFYMITQLPMAILQLLDHIRAAGSYEMRQSRDIFVLICYVNYTCKSVLLYEVSPSFRMETNRLLEPVLNRSRHRPDGSVSPRTRKERATGDEMRPLGPSA